MASGLLLLAPTVGEYLLGNIPISQYGDVLFLVPLYGAGALLVRESARRLGRGWPTIVLFGAAYALIEEGPVDQMIFNPGYLELPSFDGYAEIPGPRHQRLAPALEPGAAHGVEHLRPDRAGRGVRPDADAALAGPLRSGGRPVCSSWPAACSSAWSRRRTSTSSGRRCSSRCRSPRSSGSWSRRWSWTGPCAPDPVRTAPHPIVVAAAAFAVTSGYWLSTELPVDGALGALLAVACFAAVALGSAWGVRRWSRRPGWDGRHRLALAGGAAATYATWFGPSQAAEAGTGPAEAAWGAVVFGLAVTALVLLAALRQRRLVGTSG